MKPQISITKTYLESLYLREAVLFVSQNHIQ